MSGERPVPHADRDSERYWAAAREGRLELQQCSACGAWRWPARALCNRCQSFDAEWRPVSGLGRVVSWVVTHQPFAPSFADALPLTTVAVALDEQDDVVLLGNLLRGDPADGLAVRAVFEETAAGVTLVQWEPA